ncbi:MAG: DUF1376 domain-containing protein [Ferrovibrio sp.]|nr:DUF1376 domain-containing protein [Ferrovibrio sp.]
MTELPAPPTPADADLKDFAFMPLEVGRLLRSKAWLICKRRPDLAFYMLNLWLSAWHSVPAGSLEDDDDVLADMAKCDPAKWEKVKKDALRNWYKASDGNLYHPVVAEKVNEAWQDKAEYRWKKEVDRIRKENKQRAEKGELPLEFPPKPIRNSERMASEFQRSADGIPAENALKGKGKGEGEGKGKGKGKGESPTVSAGEVSDGKPDPSSASTSTSPLDQNTPERRLADRFLALRDELWPNEVRLPSPGLTLLSQAKGFLGEEPLHEPLIAEVLDRGMRQQAANGQPAPTSLKAYGLSIERAIANHRQASKPAAVNPRSAPAQADPELLAKQRNRAVSLFRRGVEWSTDFGPAPDHEGCLADHAVLVEHGYRKAEA